jgi:hypothetical protein
MWPMPSCLSARPTWVSWVLGDLAAGLGGEEIVAAAVAVELHEQAVPRDHLDQPAKAAQRAFLLDQEGRVDLARGVVHGDDQVERLLIGEPDVLRAVLVQHHATHRPARPLAAMGAAPRRRPHRAGLLEVEPGGGVAELVAVPMLELLVEVLDGEALVRLLIQRAHTLELVLGRPPGRRLADPAVDQAVGPVLLVALPPTAQGPFADPERRRRLAMAQPTPLPALQQLLETHDPDPRQPLHPAPRSRTLERFQNRTDHALPKPANSRALYRRRTLGLAWNDGRGRIRRRHRGDRS